jgi:hypothetical protein
MTTLEKWINRMLVSLLSLAITGCTMGKPIPFEQVQYLSPEQTTRSELLDKFGAPMSIVGRKDTIVLPTPSIRGYFDPAHFPDAIYELRGDTFFTLFPEVKNDNYNDKVYYYYSAVSQKLPIPLFVYWGYSGSTQIDQLWVLVNESTGMVENFAYRQQGKDTVFGRSP